MARLLVNPRSSTAWEIELKPGPNFLGRNPTNNFRIEDPSVSGSHCEIVIDEGGIFLRDLGSTNGTFVNEAPVTEAKVSPGQSIRLGKVEMRLAAPAALASDSTRQRVTSTADPRGVAGWERPQTSSEPRIAFEKWTRCATVKPVHTCQKSCFAPI